jgi:hypothetical protein
VAEPHDQVHAIDGGGSVLRARRSLGSLLGSRKLKAALVAVLVATMAVVAGGLIFGSHSRIPVQPNRQVPASYAPGQELANNSTGENNSSAIPAGEIMGAGSWSLIEGDYAPILASLSANHTHWAISGSITATPAVGAFVMTWAQYQSWGAIGIPSNTTWTYGANVTSVSLDLTLSPGVYMLILEDFYGPQSTIDITSAIMATPSA